MLTKDKIKPNFGRIGKIKVGEKVNNIPRSIDYFRATSKVKIIEGQNIIYIHVDNFQYRIFQLLQKIGVLECTFEILVALCLWSWISCNFLRKWKPKNKNFGSKQESNSADPLTGDIVLDVHFVMVVLEFFHTLKVHQSFVSKS